MVQPVVPNQELPIVPPQKVLGSPQIGYFLPCEIGSSHIFVHLFQAGGDLG